MRPSLEKVSPLGILILCCYILLQLKLCAHISMVLGYVNVMIIESGGTSDDNRVRGYLPLKNHQGGGQMLFCLIEKTIVFFFCFTLIFTEKLGLFSWDTSSRYVCSPFSHRVYH